MAQVPGVLWQILLIVVVVVLLVWAAHQLGFHF
jgi:hypothetical protein